MSCLIVHIKDNFYYVHASDNWKQLLFWIYILWSKPIWDCAFLLLFLWVVYLKVFDLDKRLGFFLFAYFHWYWQQIGPEFNVVENLRIIDSKTLFGTWFIHIVKWNKFEIVSTVKLKLHFFDFELSDKQQTLFLIFNFCKRLGFEWILWILLKLNLFLVNFISIGQIFNLSESLILEILWNFEILKRFIRFLLQKLKLFLFFFGRGSEFFFDVVVYKMLPMKHQVRSSR